MFGPKQTHIATPPLVAQGVVGELCGSIVGNPRRITRAAGVVIRALLPRVSTVITTGLESQHLNAVVVVVVATTMTTTAMSWTRILTTTISSARSHVGTVDGGSAGVATPTSKSSTSRSFLSGKRSSHREGTLATATERVKMAQRLRRRNDNDNDEEAPTVMLGWREQRHGPTATAATTTQPHPMWRLGQLIPILSIFWARIT